jgi:hypothetical protein
MEKSDRDEVREMLTDILAGHMAKQDGQYANLNLRMDNQDYKIEQILEQALKTNGRVTNMETKPHPVANCPQAAVIKGLAEDVTSMKAEKKFLVRTAAFVAAAIAAATSILKFIL